jgi:hypothetical protein
MNIEYRRKTNLDIDVERQIRVWPLSAIVILILSTIWTVVLLFSKDLDGNVLPRLCH